LSQRPVPGTRSASAEPGAGRSGVPYLVLHPMGFSVPPRLRLERWALTPPFHPYPALAEANIRQTPGDRVRTPRLAQTHGGFRKSGAVCFLWHFPSGCLAASPPACIPKPDPPFGGAPGYAASRPLVFGLSSPSLRRKRSSTLPKSELIYVVLSVLASGRGVAK